MGLHFDYRLVLGDKAYSWATKKEMPEVGKSIVLFEQPVHDRGYALSQEVHIPTGQYGAGVTKLEFARKAKIGEHATQTQFTIEAGKDRFLLKHIPGSQWGEKAWLFRNLGPKSKIEEKAREKKASIMINNKYLEKIADAISASEVSGEDWKKLEQRPELKAKVLLQGGYHGKANSFPAVGIKNTNANEFLDSRNVYQATSGGEM